MVDYMVLAVGRSVFKVLSCQSLAGAGPRGRATMRVDMVVLAAVSTNRQESGRRFIVVAQKGVQAVSPGSALLERTIRILSSAAGVCGVWASL